MAETTLGTQGLLNADLVLVQNVSFSATIIHENDDGTPVDHTGWTAYCQAQGRQTFILSDSVSFGDSGEIYIYITDEQTNSMPTGTYNWDIICEDQAGYAIRLVYGKATVYDSFARDE